MQRRVPLGASGGHLWYGRPMNTQPNLSRRSFLGLVAAVPLSARILEAAASEQIPIGLELYSVRNDLAKNLMGTLDGVAKMGYQCVEFFAPYYEWTADYAKQVRQKIDSLGLRTYSTHNDAPSFTPEGIGKAMELNHILGTRYIVMAYPGDFTTLDEWKRVAETLNQANAKMEPSGFHAGYHNHDAEWRPIEGKKPMEVIAANTDKSIMLQFDVGTCLEAGSDPVAWVESNPGRIKSLHLKDWSPKGGYSVLFGEGVAPWKKLLDAAASVGGAEYYLIEQEGSRYSEMETAKLCLADYHKLMG
jgi:sugar phosphate isomerase/epimerase